MSPILRFLLCVAASSFALSGCSTPKSSPKGRVSDTEPRTETLAGEKAAVVEKLLKADAKDRLHLQSDRPVRLGYTKFPCYQFEVPPGLFPAERNTGYIVQVNGKRVIFTVAYKTTAMACRQL